MTEKNTNKRTYMTHSFIDVQIYFILSINFLIVAVKAHLADENETGLDISEQGECHWF